MTKTLIRLAAFAMMAALMMALCPAALAATGESDAPGITVTVDDSIDNVIYNNTAEVFAKIENTTAYTIALASATSTTKRAVNSIAVTDASIAPGETGYVMLTITTYPTVTEDVRELVQFSFNTVPADGSAPVFLGNAKKYITLRYASWGNMPSPDPTDPTVTPAPDGTTLPQLRLSSYDEEGKFVPSPSGNSGGEIMLRIPLLCTRGFVQNLTITPVLSTDLEAFPFDITAVDYTLGYPGRISMGRVAEFRYTLTLAKKATAGVKKVDFTLNWMDGDRGPQTATMSIYVNIVKGYVAPSISPDPGTALTMPKLIVESYELSSERIYAGETFDLTFTMRNTSTTEAIENLQISVKDSAEVGKLVPANSGSNTLYVAKIAKGETCTQKISFQSAPDTEAKAYTLEFAFSYQGGSSKQAYTATETCSVAILQRIRLKFDDLVVYDEAWMGQSCAMYTALYNMGKSSVYNVMVDVEAEGLAMEETYFGGTVAAGGSMRADFNVIPSVAGQIDGFVVITYEDVFGEQMQEKLPLSLFVNEQAPIEDPTMGGVEPMVPGKDVSGGVAGGGFPWLWVGLAGAVVAGVIATVIVRKHNRAKELEDV